MRQVLAFLCFLLNSLPLANPASVGSSQAGAGRDGVKNLNEAHVKALQAGNVEEIMKLYAEDAVFYPPGEKTARGPEEIRRKWSSLLNANRVKLCRLQDPTYISSATLSVGWGKLSLALEPKSGKEPITIQGRFSAVAQKREHRWLYVFVGIADLDEILTLRHYSKED